jgi:uncharacterized Zn finger protein
MSGRYVPWSDYSSSGPIAVEGGIKAKSKRGAIGEQWWSRRFIAVLESWGMSGRLQRGRSYARKGQVLEFSLTQGKVTAQVQGSRPRPYKVTIGVLPLTTSQWRSVESRLAAQALFRARLLAGDMPPEIEQVFADCGTPLFPRSARDLTMSCSCPDWEVPCKHLAAVCYVLAEAFDSDPFTVLAWRGKARDDLLAALRGKMPADTRGVGAERPAAPGSPALALLADVTAPPLEKTLASFWSPGLSQARLRALPPSPATPPDLLLRMSDRLDVQVRGTDLKELLAPAYDQLRPSSLRFPSGGAMHSFGLVLALLVLGMLVPGEPASPSPRPRHPRPSASGSGSSAACNANSTRHMPKFREMLALSVSAAAAGSDDVRHGADTRHRGDNTAGHRDPGDLVLDFVSFHRKERLLELRFKTCQRSACLRNSTGRYRDSRMNTPVGRSGTSSKVTAQPPGMLARIPG